MYRIKELSQITGVSSETIRYYERSGVLPPAPRAENGYRIYTDTDVERLRFVSGARHLDISLKEIAGILTVRDQGVAPCIHLQKLVERQIVEVERHMKELQRLRDELLHIRDMGQDLPEDVEMEDCICGLIKIKLEETNEQATN